MTTKTPRKNKPLVGTNGDLAPWLKKAGHTRETLENRLWRKVKKRGPSDCWPFLGMTISGYGAIRVQRWQGDIKVLTVITAHRLAYALARGGTVGYLSHSCNNRLCCNPAHLMVGRQIYRSPKGSGKLFAHQVLAIRGALDVMHPPSQAYLAKQYGITRAAVSNIALGTSWKTLFLHPTT